jgi:pimeloyl-ACP methyl ester carboxylesterase
MQATSIETADGRSLDVYVSGPEDGDVLLVHDGTPGAGIIAPTLVATAGSRHLRVVSFSRPGYGASTRRPGRSVADVAEDATAVLDHVGASRCYTIGFSGGGPHTLACAALLPDRVRAATVVASVAPPDAAGLDFLAGMGRENVEEFGAAAAGTDALQRFLGAWLTSLGMVTGEEVADALGDLVPPVDRAALNGEYADSLAADIRQALRNGFWGWHDDDLAFTRQWGFDLDQVRVPLTLWQGAEDRMVPFAHGQWLADHVPGIRANLLPDHGHLSLAVASDAVILDDLIASATRGVR